MAKSLSNSTAKTMQDSPFGEEKTRSKVTTNLLESYLYGKNTVLALDTEHTEHEKNLENKKVDKDDGSNKGKSGHLELACVTKRKNDNNPLQSLHQLVHTTDEHKCDYAIRHTYAVTSFPDEVQLCTSSIPGAKYGVCAKKDLPAGTWIGPYEGRRTTEQRPLNPSESNEHMWEIYEEGNVSHFIDGSDESSSSWMRFIRCARNKKEQNMSAYQYGQNIYYRSFRDIPVGDELLVWYSDVYVKHLEIPVGLPETEQGNIGTPEILNYPEGSVMSPSFPLQKFGSDNYSTKPTMSQLPSFPFSNELPKAYEQGHVSGMEKSTVWGTPQFFKPATSVTQQTLANQKGERFFSEEPRLPQDKEISSNPHGEIPKWNHKDYVGYPGIENIEAGLRGDGRGTTEPLVDGSEIKASLMDSLSSPFQCKQCLKVFTQRIQLQMHVCPKSPYKPFQCGHCTLSFTHSSELRNHVIIHTSERPFKCGFCGRSFAGATTLNNHVRTHTGEKPFVCNNCGKTFSIATQLSRHVKTPGECSKYTATETVRQ